MRALAALALLALTLPGCIEEGPAPLPAEPAGPRGAARAPPAAATPANPNDPVAMAGCEGLAVWREPGLYDALLAARDHDRTLDYVERAAPRSLPHAGGDEEWTGAALAEVRWSREKDSLSLTLPPVQEGDAPRVHAMLPPDRDAASLREAFLRFTGAATAASEDERAAWFDAFAASKHPALIKHTDAEGETVAAYGYVVNITGTFTLDALEATLREADATPEESGFASALQREWQAGEARWTFRYEFPSRTLVASTPEGPMMIRASGSGDAELRSDSDHGMDDEALQGWVRRAFADLGLPAPALEAWRPEGSVC